MTVYHRESQRRVNVFCHLFVWILNWRGPLKRKVKGPLKSAEVSCLPESGTASKLHRISPVWMFYTFSELYVVQ